MFDVLYETYDAWRYERIRNAEVRRINADTRVIEAQRRRFEAAVNFAVSRLQAEIRTTQLLMERDEIVYERAFRAHCRSLPMAHARMLLEHDLAMQELWRDRELLIQQRRAIAAGRLTAIPAGSSLRSITSGNGSSVFEEAHDPDELERISLVAWSDLRQLSPRQQRAKFQELEAYLSEQLAPYDAQTVLERIETLLETVG